MSHYAIGDVQGCYDELMQLLDVIAFNEHDDTLWFTGDIMNGGPHDLSVLRFIAHLPQKAVTVLGNHDLHFLAVFYGIRELQSDDTFEAILKAPDAEVLVHWLKSQPLVYHHEALNCLMIHAGILPFWTLSETLNYAKTIETYLRSDDENTLRHFLHIIFGIQDDPQSTHLRWLVDVFTRIRFCDKHNQLNLYYKGTVANAPTGFFPWFQADHGLWTSMDILFGHWAALENTHVKPPHVFALDTGCVWGGKLSALRVEDKHWFQVNGRKYR